MELVDMAECESTLCVVFCVAELVFASGSMHQHAYHLVQILSAQDIPFPRRTLLSRCVLRGCVGVGFMLYAYHLAQILRAQDTAPTKLDASRVLATPATKGLGDMLGHQ